MRTAVGTILNDDVNASISDAAVYEGDTGTTNAVFTIVVSGLIPYDTAVNWATDDVTAQGGLDYVASSGSLTFPAGGGTATITVPVIGDRLNEGTETFHVNLSYPVGLHIIHGQGTGTIYDNDPLPSVYVNDVQVRSQQDGMLSAIFTVALNVPSGQEVDVPYATGDGSAVASLNYLPTSGTVTFAPGTTTLQVTVPVITSSVSAPDEQFYVNLGSPTHARIADGQGVGTISFAPPLPPEAVIDDGDSGFTATSGWTNLTNLLAYNLDYDSHPAGNGSGAATWKFTGLLPGPYQVFTKWVPFSNRATNAPYTILNGSATLATVNVNQQLAPAGETDNGIVWQSLGTFSINTGSMTVRLNDNANGYVIADAVRIVFGGVVPLFPLMDVDSSGQSIANRDFTPSTSDGTDFGGASSLTGSVTHTFLIANNGNGPLHLGGTPRVTVDDTADFSVVSQPAYTVAPGTTTSFTLMFHPGSTGLHQATVSIVNDNDSQHPYTFEVQGFGNDQGPIQLVEDDSAASSIVGNWQVNSILSAYQGAVRTDAGGQGADHATWTFDSLAPGTYTAYATWVPNANQATNAPFTVADGSVSSTTTLVNQQFAPNNLATLGLAWETLTTLFVTSGTATITLTNQANGNVTADAVMLVRDDLPGAAIATSSVLHNSGMPNDVNDDGRITTNDALLIISRRAQWRVGQPLGRRRQPAGPILRRQWRRPHYHQRRPERDQLPAAPDAHGGSRDWEQYGIAQCRYTQHRRTQRRGSRAKLRWRVLVGCALAGGRRSSRAATDQLVDGNVDPAIGGPRHGSASFSHCRGANARRHDTHRHDFSQEFLCLECQTERHQRL